MLSSRVIAPLAGALLATLVAGTASRADAAFHLWNIAEVYTSADGRAQYVELSDAYTGENFVSGLTVTTDSDGLVRSFTLPANLVGDTAGKRLLIATPGFASLPGAVTPDFVLPCAPFFNPNATFLTIRYSGSNATWMLLGSQVPKNGASSVVAPGPPAVTAQSRPQNFSSQVGSLNLPACLTTVCPGCSCCAGGFCGACAAPIPAVPERTGGALVALLGSVVFLALYLAPRVRVARSARTRSASRNPDE